MLWVEILIEEVMSVVPETAKFECGAISPQNQSLGNFGPSEM